jgi:hypothetical protein
MSTTDEGTRARLRRVVLAAGLLVAVATAAIVVAGPLGGRQTAHAGSAVESVQAQYSILRSAATGDLTAVASRAEAQDASGPVWFQDSGGPAVATAREAAVDVPGLRVWVAATEQGEICVLSMQTGQPDIAGPGGTCASGELGSSGAILEEPADGAHPGYLIGVVPDEVPEATIQKADGTTEQVRVSDNVYVVSPTSAVTDVSFEKGGSTHTIRTGGGR